MNPTPMKRIRGQSRFAAQKKIYEIRKIGRPHASYLAGRPRNPSTASGRPRHLFWGHRMEHRHHPHLSPREEQTLDRLLCGDQESEIARFLGVSQSRVHDLVKSLYRKYGASSRGELLAVFVSRLRDTAARACQRALSPVGLRAIAAELSESKAFRPISRRLVETVRAMEAIRAELGREPKLPHQGGAARAIHEPSRRAAARPVPGGCQRRPNSGQPWLPAVRKLALGVNDSRSPRYRMEHTRHPHLSPREEQTLDRLLCGDQAKEIARHLGLSQHTIHTFIKSIYRKYGARSRACLFAIFVAGLRDTATRACDGALSPAGLRAIAAELSESRVFRPVSRRLAATVRAMEAVKRELAREPRLPAPCRRPRRKSINRVAPRPRGFVPRGMPAVTQ